MPTLPTTCPHCGGDSLYTCKTNSTGGYGPALLPGLGSFWKGFAKFHAVLCADCGHYLLFAEEEARQKVAHSPKWKRV